MKPSTPYEIKQAEIQKRIKTAMCDKLLHDGVMWLKEIGYSKKQILDMVKAAIDEGTK